MKRSDLRTINITKKSPDTPVMSNSAKKPDRSMSPLILMEIPIFSQPANFANEEYPLHHDAL
jgi:hypothetical protein